MKKKIRVLVLTLVLTIGIIGMSIVAYACKNGSYVLYNRYNVAPGAGPFTCTEHQNCTIRYCYFENIYRCTWCGDIKNVTTYEPVHSNP